MYVFLYLPKIICYSYFSVYARLKEAEMDYRKLQNGSDIRGIALEGIEGQHVNLTEDACKKIGRAFAVYMKKRLGTEDVRIAIGRDSRLSGPQLLSWAADGLTFEGARVTDLGLSSTPSMFMCTVTEGFRFDGAVMVTASHLPFNRNGYKFFTAEGGLEHEDISEILGTSVGALKASYHFAKEKILQELDIKNKNIKLDRKKIVKELLDD